MMRLSFALIGIGLAVFFIVGLSTGATIWLTWLNGVAALLSFLALALIGDPRSPLAAGLFLGLVALGLAVLWLVAIGTGETGWLVWCTFAAALVTGLVALAASFTALLEDGPIERLQRQRSR